MNHLRIRRSGVRISPGALRKGAGQNPWPAPLRFGLWHLDSHADSHRCKIDNGPLQTTADRRAKLNVCPTELTIRPGDGGSVRLAYRLEEAAEPVSDTLAFTG